MMSDLMNPQQEAELEHFVKAIGPHALVTDTDITFGKSFNLHSSTPLIINGRVFIHNAHTYNEYSKSDMNIFVSDNISNMPGDLNLLTGDNFRNYTVNNGTYFGVQNGRKFAVCGGQPSTTVNWCFFLINKENLQLFWGMHSMQWAMNLDVYSLDKEDNSQTIYDKAEELNDS
jgi:hypothetical protein